MKIKPIIEQYIYERAGIQIGMKIDYAKKTISLVEQDGKKKQWLFAERGLEYMQGWLNILNIMKEAIEHAETRLKAYEDEELKDFAAMASMQDGVKK